MLRVFKAAPLAAAVLIVCSTLTFPASAQNLEGVMASPVTIDAPWARASLARSAAAYLTLRNASDAPVRVVGAESPAAKRVELHNHIMEGNIARMRQVPYIEVPANGAVTLKPGGLHVMMMGLAKPLKEGESFRLTLTLAGGKTVTANVPVRAMGAMSPGMGGMQGHGMH